jgi:hypothetical protein
VLVPVLLCAYLLPVYDLAVGYIYSLSLVPGGHSAPRRTSRAHSVGPSSRVAPGHSRELYPKGSHGHTCLSHAQHTSYQGGAHQCTRTSAPDSSVLESQVIWLVDVPSLTLYFDGDTYYLCGGRVITCIVQDTSLIDDETAACGETHCMAILADTLLKRLAEVAQRGLGSPGLAGGLRCRLCRIRDLCHPSG